MSRSFDKSLHVLLPSPCDQFSHGIEFGKLSSIVGIGYASRAQSVAKRESHIILCHDIADIIEMFIQETFLLMYEAPLGHDTASSAYDATQTIVRQMHIMESDACMNGEIVHALLTLFDECILIYLP